jgi:signal transduction histidine kinase
MNAEATLRLFTRAVLVLIAGRTLIDFLRERHRTRLDIALMFFSLASSILLSELAPAAGPFTRWVATLGSIAVVAQPYLLLQLVDHFRPVPTALRGAALAGLVVSWVILLAAAPPLSPTATLVVVIYFALVEAYGAVAFVRGALGSGGVSRRRMTLVAAGSGLLALAVLVAGLPAAVPSIAKSIQPLIDILGAAAVLCYYLGFAPPSRLHRGWQLAELHKFLQELAGRPFTAHGTETLTALCVAATRIGGGYAAAAARWNEGAERFEIQASDHPLLQAVAFEPQAGAVARAWQDHRPAAARRVADFGSGELQRIAAQLGAAGLLAIPITARGQAWGLLVELLRRGSLFIDDDLALLALLAEQSAIRLDYNKALAELEAANKELEAFAYSISHDLRAPLRAIDGFSRILLEEQGPQLSEDGTRYLHLVRENTQQMGRLVDDLLAFSRLSRQPLKRQRVSPADTVRAALADLGADQQGRSVAINIANLPECQADPALLKQVYVNLLSNALKFTRQRQKAVVEVGFQLAPVTGAAVPTQDGGAGAPAPQPESRPERVYYVRDNGVGFDMRYVDKLFGVFQRLHRAEDYEGTGVGLAIVQRIIQRHGGRVWAEAALDRGATFYFTLGGTHG